MKSRKLIDVLDKSSVNLSRLATLLQAQLDELTSCDDDMGGDSDNWKYRKDQILVIGNLVMNHLNQYSKHFGKLVANYNIQNAKKR